MRSIADGGSTKTEWILLDGQRVALRFQTVGFNPNYTDVGTIAAIISEAFPHDFPHPVDEINYYGSGCGAPKNREVLKDIFLQRFPSAKVMVTHDLMAAAHALFGAEKGIACILGTGANSCLYDGNDIVEMGVSLGYLVGDEGSGTNIGKAVAKSYYYGFMPKDLRADFEATYHLDLKDFVPRLYHQAQPNLFLSEFSKFAGEHKTHPFIIELVSGCFDDFIKAFVCRYDGYKSLKVSFVGSVAVHFQAILKDCLQKHGILLGTMAINPCEGLIRYYREN